MMNHRLLTLDEELALGRRIQSGDKGAFEELVEHNLRLVHKIARKFYADDPAMTYDDLVQIGMLGLLTAARRYDPERGNRFATYATWWIRQHIQRAALTSGPIQRSANPGYQHQRPASARIQAIRQMPVARLDTPLRDRRGDDSDNTLGDITASAGPSVEEQVLSRIETESLFSALRLNPRGQAIVRDWLSGMPRDEAQQMHGVSHSWIHSMLKSRKERLMSQNGLTPQICKEDGCNEVRMVSKNGAVLSYCPEHQRAYWREAARASKQNKQQHPATSTRLRRQVRPLPPPEETPALGVVDEVLPSVEQIAPGDHGCNDACDACIYRQVLDLVAERYPDVAELVSAMLTVNKWRR